MLKNLRWFVWLFVLLTAFSIALNAQTNFVYTNNDPYNAENSVSAFSMDNSSLCAPPANQAPCQISGSPFPTGGNGTASTAYSPNRIIVVNDFLYASNAGSNTVSAFTINSSTGYLTPVTGSPFSTNAFNASPSGISLAATPDGKYLYAGSTGFNGQITIFTIEASGALQFDAVTPYGFVGGAMSSMKVTPQKVMVGANDEYLLAVALSQANEVALFEIKSDGTLAELSGSPFSTLVDSSVEAGYTTGIDINCASNLLFAGRSNSPYIDVFKLSVDSNGALTAPGLTPVKTGGQSNQVVVLVHPHDGTPEQVLFGSDPNTASPSVGALSVATDGSLTFVGSTSAAGSSGQTVSLGPGGLAVSQNGDFLYAADASVGGFGAITTFGLSGSSAPSFDSLKSTNQSFGLNSLAAYPANVCSTSAGDTTPKLTVTKILIPPSDPRRFNLQINGTTLATNVGDGGTTGPQDGAIGTNTVSETVGTPGTSLSDFIAVIGGDCAADGTITLAAGDNKTCTITNTRKLPTLTGIDPASAFVGGPAFSMNLTGTNFGEDSTARFNGSDLTTHYTSPDTTHLAADVPASDLTKVGQFPITVHNSLPTVGSSSSLTFNVYYKFLGLFEPYSASPGHYRVTRSIPLRWQYATANGAPTPSPDADPLVEVYPAAGCGSSSTGNILTVSSPGDSGYRYHAPSMTWQFNWKTGGNVGAGCYVIYIKSRLTGQKDGPFPIRLIK